MHIVGKGDFSNSASPVARLSTKATTRQPRNPENHAENRQGCHTATSIRLLATLRCCRAPDSTSSGRSRGGAVVVPFMRSQPRNDRTTGRPGATEDPLHHVQDSRQRGIRARAWVCSGILLSDRCTDRKLSAPCGRRSGGHKSPPLRVFLVRKPCEH